MQIDEVTVGIAHIKSWNRFRKIWAYLSSQELEPRYRHVPPQEKKKNPTNSASSIRSYSRS